MKNITLGERAKLALDVINGEPAREIPSWLVHLMEHRSIEYFAGAQPGEYKNDPDRVYLAFKNAIGTCLIDQWIPRNPLSMGDCGFEGAEKGATTGAEEIVRDGIAIDSPESVVEHMEKIVFPSIRASIESFDEDALVAKIIANENAVQELLAPDILKSGYGFVRFPGLAYGTYGYANYFMAYALYPDVIERHFSLSADLCELNNRAAARAYREGGLPPLYRLDHDMADSRGTLVDIRSLDRIWFPHFARCIKPLVEAGVRLIWHCDGNLMQMVPRLIDAGVGGFQGFQYEDGMDYERICSMRTRDGEELLIVAGVSVTTTLPYGKPEDVKCELARLVQFGPRNRLLLACSSSVAPGVPLENLKALVEGLKFYRINGRSEY